MTTGKMQQCSGDVLGPSQPSVSIIIIQTLQALVTPETTNICLFQGLATRIREEKTRILSSCMFSRSYRRDIWNTNKNNCTKRV